MLKHLVLLSLVIVSVWSCQPDQNSQEQPEVNLLKESKLDSIRSLATIIIDNGDLLNDSRSSISYGSYKTDESQTLRSIRFSLKDLNIADASEGLTIDMINLEEWDSSRQHTITVDSAFLLNPISHLALSKITLGDITNELLLPIRVTQDSVESYVEGKTTLTLKNWGFDLPEQYKLHLGLSLYTLSEN